MPVLDVKLAQQLRLALVIPNPVDLFCDDCLVIIELFSSQTLFGCTGTSCNGLHIIIVIIIKKVIVEIRIVKVLRSFGMLRLGLTSQNPFVIDEITIMVVSKVTIPVVVHLQGVLPSKVVELAQHFRCRLANLLREETPQELVHAVIAVIAPALIEPLRPTGKRNNTCLAIVAGHIVTIVLVPIISMSIIGDVRLDALRFQFLFCSFHNSSLLILSKVMHGTDHDFMVQHNEFFKFCCKVTNNYCISKIKTNKNSALENFWF